MSRKNSKKRKQSSWIWSILDGSLLTREVLRNNIGFLIFLAFIAMAYIYNKYRTENVIRHIAQINKEIKELQSESVSISSELVFLCNQTNISKLLKKNNLNLRVADKPPKIIKIYKKSEDTN